MPEQCFIFLDARICVNTRFLKWNILNESTDRPCLKNILNQY